MKINLTSPHAMPFEEVLNELKSSEQGISNEEANQRLNVYGLNELPSKRQFSLFFLLLKQFKSWLVILLFIAAIISFFADQFIDAIVILIIVAVNAAIGFVQELKAEEAISSLQNLVVETAKVLRNNQLLSIPSSQITIGDVIIIEEGDRIPADGRIIYAKNLRTLEASLTGESLPISKNENIYPINAVSSDQKNMVWKGTFVAGGYAKAVVTAVGSETKIGNISSSLLEIKKEIPNFLKKTNYLAKQMSLIAIGSAGLIFIIGYFIRHYDLQEIILVTTAALVAAIPEGLPAIITIVLAIGARRMAIKGAIIREFNATETLGNVTAILTDKTGTLTYNSLTVKSIFLPGKKEEFTITGEGWMPVGNFLQHSEVIDPEKSPDLQKLLKIAAVSNNATIKYDEKEDAYILIGDPTEGALSVLAKKGGLYPEKLAEDKLDDFPFNSTDKLRATLIKDGGCNMAYIVGSPEQLLERSNRIYRNDEIVSLRSDDKLSIEHKIKDWSSNSLRVIALAFLEHDGESLDEISYDKLIFAGIVGMIDPPRKEVKVAVEKCKKAGIRVVMVTGDHINTAIAIARKTGIIDDEIDSDAVIALTEQQLSKLDDHEFEKAVRTISVFARLTPKMKLRIARTLQKQGQLIAMTGDGVNDAPALKQADIGISMGKMGTDVARENAQMVLADDNFSTIVDAIEEGRIVFTNAQQTSFFLVTTNIAESATLIIALALGFPAPLLATQILWLNLVTDSLPAIALANEKGHENIMNGLVEHRKSDILNRKVFPFLIINVSIMASLSIVAFNYYLDKSGLDVARTAVFIVMASTQMFNVFNMRSLKESTFKIGFFKNKFVNGAVAISMLLIILITEIPFLAQLFHFEAVRWSDFVILFSSSVLVLIAGELYKLYRRTKLISIVE